MGVGVNVTDWESCSESRWIAQREAWDARVGIAACLTVAGGRAAFLFPFSLAVAAAALRSASFLRL